MCVIDKKHNSKKNTSNQIIVHCKVHPRLKRQELVNDCTDGKIHQNGFVSLDHNENHRLWWEEEKRESEREREKSDRGEKREGEYNVQHDHS